MTIPCIFSVQWDVCNAAWCVSSTDIVLYATGVDRVLKTNLKMMLWWWLYWWVKKAVVFVFYMMGGMQHNPGRTYYTMHSRLCKVTVRKKRARWARNMDKANTTFHSALKKINKYIKLYIICYIHNTHTTYAYCLCKQSVIFVCTEHSVRALGAESIYFPPSLATDG
jgi:hypothetical protein